MARLFCRRGGSGRAGQAASAYIKISEEEIADDYPEPTQYDKVEEETDELLLAEEDLWDADPEDLPRRLLSDFSVYNAEARFPVFHTQKPRGSLTQKLPHLPVTVLDQQP